MIFDISPIKPASFFVIFAKTSKTPEKHTKTPRKCQKWRKSTFLTSFSTVFRSKNVIFDRFCDFMKDCKPKKCVFVKMALSVSLLHKIPPISLAYLHPGSPSSPTASASKTTNKCKIHVICRYRAVVYTQTSSHQRQVYLLAGRRSRTWPIYTWFAV